jgi:hypothetical protein
VASSHAAACTAPADYGDLFIEYGSEIRTMVRTQLGSVAQPGDVDDGVQYILGQFIRNDVIAQFQPGYINDYNHKPTTFRAFIKNKVALYCRGLRESIARQQGRELQVLGNENSEAAYALDVIGAVSDEYPSLAGEGMDLLREKLAGRTSPDGEDVLPLFEVLAQRFERGQSVSAAAVRKEFGKTRAEADAWFASLKDALRDVPAEAPEPESEPSEAEKAAAWFRRLYETASGQFTLGGVAMTADEARRALEALRATRGNQVLRAFKDAVHPLAEAGKTWYLAFADDVMDNYPELRAPVRRHADGHFGRVKYALVAGLEILLGDVTEPEPVAAVLPEPAPVPEDVAVPVAVPVSEPAGKDVLPPEESSALWADLESAIARLPGFEQPASVEAALEAVRLLSLTPV